MRRNAIPFNILLQLAEEFCAEKELNSKKKRRGRPPLYPLSLILAMWLWKTMLKLSYRREKQFYIALFLKIYLISPLCIIECLRLLKIYGQNS